MKTMPQSNESHFKLNSASFDLKHDTNCDVFPAMRRRELNRETGFDRNIDSGCNAIMLYAAPFYFYMGLPRWIGHNRLLRYNYDEVEGFQSDKVLQSLPHWCSSRAATSTRLLLVKHIVKLIDVVTNSIQKMLSSHQVSSIPLPTIAGAGNHFLNYSCPFINS